jgi:hypothetical protein
VALTDKGYPGFNRHATAHDIDADDFTAVNALRGLMLATAAVRELQYGLTDEWRNHTGIRPAHMDALRTSDTSIAQLSRNGLPALPEVRPPAEGQ